MKVCSPVNNLKMLGKRYKNDQRPTKKNMNTLQLEMKRKIERKIIEGVYSFESVPCLICNCSSFEVLSEKDRYGLFAPVAICRSCGLVQANPRMTQDSYNLFYNDEYRKLYGGEKKPIEEYFRSQYHRGRNIHEYLKQHNVIKKTVTEIFVLEIGCSSGGILLYFKELGCHVRGVDPGEEYINWGVKHYDLDLSVGTIQNIQNSRSPDIIIYSHSLEHMLNPQDELTQVKRIANQDTIVYIEVPGVKYMWNRYRMDLLLYNENAHVYHFSLSSLSNLLSKSGFSLVAGDETIRSAWNFVESVSHNYLIESDYSDAVKYLKRIEVCRRYLSFPRYTVKPLVVENLKIILKFLGLFDLAKNIYGKIKSGGWYRFF